MGATAIFSYPPFTPHPATHAATSDGKPTADASPFAHCIRSKPRSLGTPKGRGMSRVIARKPTTASSCWGSIATTVAVAFSMS